MYNILKTTFEEFSDVTDPRVTFEIQSNGEVAVDSSGPRKQWLRLCNRNINLKYFDNGLQEHLSEDYVSVGQIVCISLLQNGLLPTCTPEETPEAISTHKCQQLSSYTYNTYVWKKVSHDPLSFKAILFKGHYQVISREIVVFVERTIPRRRL